MLVIVLHLERKISVIFLTVAWRNQTMTSHFCFRNASFKHHCKIRECQLCILYKFYIIPSYIQRDMRVVSELFDPPTYFLLLKKSHFVWSTEVRFWLSIETPVNKWQHFCFDKIMWQWGVLSGKIGRRYLKPWKLRSRNFSMTLEEFLMDQKRLKQFHCIWWDDLWQRLELR